MIDFADSVKLYYTIAKDRCFLDGVKIFKQLNFDTSFGIFEVAIIGSSHYLSIKDSMLEIMSCNSPDIKTPSPIYHTLINKDFTYTYLFSGFRYNFSVKPSQYAEKAFLSAEKQLLIEDFDLFHAFKNMSAITAIRLNIKETDSISVSTWHTYPETNTIIETTTNLGLP